MHIRNEGTKVSKTLKLRSKVYLVTKTKTYSLKNKMTAELNLKAKKSCAIKNCMEPMSSPSNTCQFHGDGFAYVHFAKT